MDLSKLTNPRVREAIEALQAGNKTVWLSLFAANVKLSDDGSPRDFAAFSNEAIGHERFTSIDRVDNNGLDVYGGFHSDRWDDLDVFQVSSRRGRQIYPARHRPGIAASGSACGMSEQFVR
jgi:hypothetical protein